VVDNEGMEAVGDDTVPTQLQIDGWHDGDIAGKGQDVDGGVMTVMVIPFGIAATRESHIRVDIEERDEKTPCTKEVGLDGREDEYLYIICGCMLREGEGG